MLSRGIYVTEIEIKQKITTLTKKYNTTNPFELCDYLDITISKEDLGKLKGYYYCHNRIKIIVLNNDLNNHMAKEVCAHELGHAIMHSSLNTMFLCANTSIVVNKFENEANLFAKLLIELDQDIHIC